MTARDEVFARLGGDAQWFRHILYGLAGETFEAQEALDKFEAAHAHELAEKIRQWADEANIPGSPVSSEMVRGLAHAADLIDPEGADRDTP